MSTPRRSTQWIIAAALGAITVAGYAPFYLFALPLLSFAALFLLWQRATSARDAALIALPAALALSGLSEELQNVLFEIANAVKM